MASDNKTLGRFVLDGIPPAPRGVPQIEVSFDIDANGILHVSAKDKGTGKEQKITIQNATNLSEEEVEKMKQEAQKFAEDDKKKKDLADKRNEADTFITITNKALKDAGDKFSSDAKKEIEEAIKELEDVKNKPDVTFEEIDTQLKKTVESTQKHSEALYKAAQEGDKKEETESKGETKDDKSNSDEKPEEGEIVDDKK